MNNPLTHLTTYPAKAPIRPAKPLNPINDPSMPSTETMRRRAALTDRILYIVDHADHFTRSDLQGAVETIAMQLINDEK